MTTQTQALAGRKIEVEAHDYDLDRRYRTASVLAVAGRVYPIVQVATIQSGRQMRAAAAYIRGVRPDLAVSDVGAVEVRVSDLDGIRVRLTAVLPGTEMQVGYCETTDRTLLEPAVLAI
jgi:hypothetical protein